MVEVSDADQIPGIFMCLSLTALIFVSRLVIIESLLKNFQFRRAKPDIFLSVSANYRRRCTTRTVRQNSLISVDQKIDSAIPAVGLDLHRMSSV